MSRSVVLAASRERVWRALTDDAELSAWFGAKVQLEARPGGEGVFRWADGTARRAEVQAVEEGSRLALRWWRDRRHAAVSVVEFTLHEIDGGVRLTVAETTLGPADTPAPQPPEALTGAVGVAVDGGLDRWLLRLARLRRLVGEETRV